MGLGLRDAVRELAAAPPRARAVQQRRASFMVGGDVCAASTPCSASRRPPVPTRSAASSMQLLRPSPPHPAALPGAGSGGRLGGGLRPGAGHGLRPAGRPDDARLVLAYGAIGATPDGGARLAVAAPRRPAAGARDRAARPHSSMRCRRGTAWWPRWCRRPAAAGRGRAGAGPTPGRGTGRRPGRHQRLLRAGPTPTWRRRSTPRRRASSPSPQRRTSPRACAPSASGGRALRATTGWTRPRRAARAPSTRNPRRRAQACQPLYCPSSAHGGFCMEHHGLPVEPGAARDPRPGAPLRRARDRPRAARRPISTRLSRPRCTSAQGSSACSASTCRDGQRRRPRLPGAGAGHRGLLPRLPGHRHRAVRERALATEPIVIAGTDARPAAATSAQRPAVRSPASR